MQPSEESSVPLLCTDWALWKQRVLSESAEFEYSIGSEVPANPALPSLAHLDAPAVDPSSLDGRRAIELISEADFR